jgi:hypothetical protein
MWPSHHRAASTAASGTPASRPSGGNGARGRPATTQNPGSANTSARQAAEATPAASTQWTTRPDTPVTERTTPAYSTLSPTASTGGRDTVTAHPPRP